MVGKIRCHSHTRSDDVIKRLNINLPTVLVRAEKPYSLVVATQDLKKPIKTTRRTPTLMNPNFRTSAIELTVHRFIILVGEAASRSAEEYRFADSRIQQL